MADRPIAAAVLESVAQKQADRQQAQDCWPRPPVGQLLDAFISLDADYCRRVADYYDAAPAGPPGADLTGRYRRLMAENLRLHAAIADAGIEVAPWLGEGQPYLDSAALAREVRRTGRLWVYLTALGHGPGPSPIGHPLRTPSGIWANGVEFCHNDLMRAVHDLFGHVMLSTGFGANGEFLASLCQLMLYPRDVHPVIFTEQVGQACWFYYGPHLLTEAGSLPGRGEVGYLPLARRPYPEQKVFAYPTEFLDQFTSSFHFVRTHG